MREKRTKASAEPSGFGLVSFFLVLLGAVLAPDLSAAEWLRGLPTVSPLLMGSAFLILVVVLSGSYLGFPLLMLGCVLLGFLTKHKALQLHAQILAGSGFPWTEKLGLLVLFPIVFLMLVRGAQLSHGVYRTVLGNHGSRGRPAIDDFLLLITAVFLLTMIHSPLF